MFRTLTTQEKYLLLQIAALISIFFDVKIRFLCKGINFSLIYS